MSRVILSDVCRYLVPFRILLSTCSKYSVISGPVISHLRCKSSFAGVACSTNDPLMAAPLIDLMFNFARVLGRNEFEKTPDPKLEQQNDQLQVVHKVEDK